MWLSYADIFQHNTSYQGHPLPISQQDTIVKVESETFYRRDGTRKISRETLFGHEQSW